MGATRVQVAEFVLYGAPQSTDKRRHWKPLEYILEEPKNNEAFGLFGRHSTRCKVITLVFINRPNCRGMCAAHVIGLNHEVWDRLCAGTLGEYKISIALHRTRFLRLWSDMDQTGVNRTRRIFNGSLEQQIACCVRRRMVLEGSEIKHLIVIAVVHGYLLRLSTDALKERLASKTRV
jgi:hypothetical protein